MKQNNNSNTNTNHNNNNNNNNNNNRNCNSNTNNRNNNNSHHGAHQSIHRSCCGNMKPTMLSPTFLYDEASRRYLEISECKIALEEELRTAPPGLIHVVNSGSRTQFYLRKDRSDKGGRYIRKTDTGTIKAYIRKAYCEKVIKLLDNEIKNLEILLKKSNNITEKLQGLYSDLPSEAKQYADPVDMSDEDFVAEWLGIPYEGKEIPDHLPVYRTDQGERVRSKSELTIANMLADKGIPYKYECPLALSGGIVIYPDFTVLDVKMRKEIYWEHRGMMDDREYARQAVFKVKSMMKDDIILGKNLIITEETSANPLGTNEIEAVINNYFNPEEG